MSRRIILPAAAIAVAALISGSVYAASASAAKQPHHPAIITPITRHEKVTTGQHTQSGGTKHTQSGAPANDSYSNPLAENTPSWTLSENTVGATTEAHENLAYNDASKYRLFDTVWVTWKVPASGTITLDTTGTLANDTGLAIYTGSKITTAKRLASDDDKSSGTSYEQAEIISFPVKKGTTYHFQVGQTGAVGSSAPSGTEMILMARGDWNVPANDALANATKVSGTSFSAFGTTLGSTLETWEPTADPEISGRVRRDSVWWKWTAAATGTLDVNTAGSSAEDTYLAVFESVDGGTPEQAAFSDNAGGSIGNQGSVTGLQVIGGAKYYFEVGIPSGSDDAVRLNGQASLSGPTITKVSAGSGSHNGGKKVTITGTHLDQITEVLFGGLKDFSLVHVSSTKVTVITPAHAKGTVAVVADNQSFDDIVTAETSKTHYKFT